MKKIVVTVPVENADELRQAIGEAGGGQIGNYSFCSFSSVGRGRYLPEEGAEPTIGEVGELTEVEEERIEFSCHDIVLVDVITAIRDVHPYEEPVIDVYPIEEIEF